MGWALGGLLIQAFAVVSLEIHMICMMCVCVGERERREKEENEEKGERRERIEERKVSLFGNFFPLLKFLFWSHLEKGTNKERKRQETTL